MVWLKEVREVLRCCKIHKRKYYVVGWKPASRDFKGYDVVFNVAGIARTKKCNVIGTFIMILTVTW